MSSKAPLWESGDVKRFHICHFPAQTTADHSWGVAVLLHMLAPPEVVTKHLLLAALLHDAAEKYTGDVPYSIKENFPALRHQLKKAEEEWEKDHYIHDVLHTLDYEQNNWLKACDMLDLVLYCEREAGGARGGEAEEVMKRGLTALINNHRTPIEVLWFLQNHFCGYVGHPALKRKGPEA
jgi:5'-deoxynucleotidase YfbR-like HD superfamily hydrolase